MNLIIFILAIVLIVVGTIQWCDRKVKSGSIACAMGLRDMSRREFDRLIDKRKFTVLKSRVTTPHLFQFFAGKVNGTDTCIFSIAFDRSTHRLGVVVASLNAPLPNFVIRPKSFSGEVADMLGVRQHHVGFPAVLINYYDISSEDDGKLAALLAPDMMRFLLENEGVSIEVRSGALLVLPSLASKPSNYEPAIQRAYAFAQLLEREAQALDTSTT